MNFTHTATASIRTDRAARLAKQLISHWGRHTDDVREQAGVTTMSFAATEQWPANAVTVTATDSTLEVTVATNDPDALEDSCRAVADHLHRFAGRHDTLHIVWE